MFKQIIFPILAVVAFIVIVGILVQKSSLLKINGPSIATPTTPPTKTVSIGITKVQVQIADTAEKRSKGLSGYDSLKANEGMLFVFNPKSNPIFWMKGMLIPLDIIWIVDGKIVRIDKNVPIPAPNTTDDKLKTYSSGQPIDYVLEVNSGYSDANGVKVGSTVDLSGI